MGNDLPGESVASHNGAKPHIPERSRLGNPIQPWRATKPESDWSSSGREPASHQVSSQTACLEE